MIRTVVVVADSEAPHPAVRDMSTKGKKEILFFSYPADGKGREKGERKKQNAFFSGWRGTG